MIKIGIAGFCGKMGQRIFALARLDKKLKIKLGLEVSGHPRLGTLMGDVKISSDIKEVKNCDCLIDFTMPEGTIEHLSYLITYKKPVVIGTTGLNQAQHAQIVRASKKIPIVFSPNMSVGVNLLFQLTKTAASMLKNYHVRIEEAHHVHKKDAPSGTAKKIAQIISEQGITVKAEDIKAIREGEIVGDHKIIFESNVDRFELSHSAKTRDIFAQGALLAARWIYKKKPGLYSMSDVLALGLKD